MPDPAAPTPAGWLARRAAELRLALATPGSAARAGARFLATRPLPLPLSGLAADDRAIFLIEAARADLVSATLDLSVLPTLRWPQQFLRIAQVHVRLWLLVKAVDESFPPAGATPHAARP